MGFAVAWFFVVLAPTSSIVPIKDTLFEHRMYLSLAAVSVLFVSVAAYGNPYQHTHYHINKLQGETDEALRANTHEAESGISAASALASIPQRDGNAVGVAIAKYGSGRALAVGYTGSNEKFSYRAGVSMGNSDDAAIGAGLSYGF